MQQLQADGPGHNQHKTHGLPEPHWLTKPHDPYRPAPAHTAEPVSSGIERSTTARPGHIQR
ncbi:hypothetical protein GCM10022402_18720 [Salinactinospora qingdaonensis]|uniref:Uncharacterized protein n=1 Tax=Salinactinospora qingdaonensis TaxID=702744 RepID=A0ABP7FLS3_9ACTN